MARNENTISDSPISTCVTTKSHDKNYYLSLMNPQLMYIQDIVFLRNDHYFSSSSSSSLSFGNRDLFLSIYDPLEVLQCHEKEYYVRYHHHKNNLSHIIEFWIAKPFVDTLEERLEKIS